MSGAVVWRDCGPWWGATVCGLAVAVCHDAHRTPRDPERPWVALVQWGEWQCTSRHPTEADARAACERLAESIGGER